MKNIIREEQELLVKQLGIFELRGLARELGIPSPTTKKRDELIKLILLKFENGDIVDDKGKRKGRPCKKLSTINDIVSTIANQFNEKNAQPLVFETLVTFAQVLPTYDKNIKEDEDILSTGTKILIKNGEEILKVYIIVIYGDVNGDGKINSVDLLVLQRHILSLEAINGVYLKAGNIRKTGNKPTSVDLLLIQRHILGLQIINQ